jgi:hypothetical protein
MSYGIQIFNNNGNVLIDTLAQSQMQITEETTHSGGSSSNTLQRGNGEFILWSPQHNSGGTYTYTKFSQASNSDIITNTGSSSSVVRLRDVSQATVPTRNASNQYGIEVYNANNTVTYSDLFLKSYKILAIYPPGTVTGGDTVYTGSTTATEKIYVGAGFAWYNTSTYYEVVFGNFRVTSNNIVFQNHVIVPATGDNTVYPNFSTVVVIKLRN